MFSRSHTPQGAIVDATNLSLNVLTSRALKRIAAAGQRGAAVPFGFRKKTEKARVEDVVAELTQRHGVIAIARGGKAHYVVLGPPVEAEAVTKAVEAAGKQGRTTATLARVLKVLPQQVVPAVEALAGAGEIIGVEKGAATYWLAKRFGPPTLEGVSEALHRRFEAHADQIFLPIDLRRGFRRRAEKGLVDEALYWLEADGAVEKLRHVSGTKGKEKVFFALARVVAPEAVAAAPSLEPISDDAVIYAAYRRLAKAGPSEFVEIHDLREEAGLSVEALRTWLERGCERGRVQATGTNLVVLPPERRASTISWRGQRCALVKLLEP